MLFKYNNFELFAGDCIEIMRSLPHNYFDMILCDLPYGITACDWDSIIPLDELWKEYNRISREEAPTVLTASQPFTTVLAASNIKQFRYEWIWEKPQGTNPLNVKVMPLKSHENILIFYRKRGIYNPQMWQGTPYSGFSSDVKTIGEVYGNRPGRHRSNPEGTRYPKTILSFGQEKGLHPTQKPIKLMEYLIKTYTNIGGTVLDNCMGSGTTGVACANTNRRFVGIELDKKYFKQSVKRITYAYKISSILKDYDIKDAEVIDDDNTE